MFSLSQNCRLSLKMISSPLILLAVMIAGGVGLFLQAGVSPALAHNGTVTEAPTNTESGAQKNAVTY